MSRIDYKQPVCPVCKEECDTLIRNIYGDVVCCDVCEDRIDAWEWMEDQRHE